MAGPPRHQRQGRAHERTGNAHRRRILRRRLGPRPRVTGGGVQPVLARHVPRAVDWRLSSERGHRVAFATERRRWTIGRHEGAPMDLNEIIRWVVTHGLALLIGGVVDPVRVPARGQRGAPDRPLGPPGPGGPPARRLGRRAGRSTSASPRSRTCRCDCSASSRSRCSAPSCWACSSCGRSSPGSR